MDNITEMKIRLADITLEIGKLIRQKMALQNQLIEIQTREAVLLEQIADETERLENTTNGQSG